MNKFSKDIIHVFAVDETIKAIDEDKDFDGISKMVAERRNKWLDAKTTIKQRLDKKLNQYHAQAIIAKNQNDG